MNNLQRVIQRGEEVVVSKQVVEGDARQRRFQCENGSGLYPHQPGKTIYGNWVVTGERGVIDGNEIDVEETKALREPRQKRAAPVGKSAR